MKTSLKQTALGFERAKKTFRNMLSAGLESLYPSICEICDDDLDRVAQDDARFCQNCRDSLVRNEGPCCPRCAAPAPVDSMEGCPRCRGRKLKFSSAIALGIYQSVLQEAVLRMKLRTSEPLAASIGRLLSARFGKKLANEDIDIIAPVPMHWSRRIQRGFNSPDVLAVQMSRLLRVPARLGLIRCRRNIKQQSSLTRNQRFENVHKAYHASTGYDINGAHVLVIDDILTTGATADEAARSLLAAGAAKVSVAVAARTLSSDY